ncbi:MAG: lysozyme [Hafniaceae bacterium]|jgi:lysozyme|uniref:lysozyme n=1 Tax=Obesumbacterium proteus TaxID=82983 RepID=UPI001F30B559|nr:lysozyme [Obesumbacterium proteus]MDN5986322.1 lysozyme [Hafniaceae bacterium]MDN6114890.1 lysozyme [Enterobacterales bacterium]MCE9883930.1 lysozyme [Obesumbacterium proteus]MCE9917678.1 lysozyme [Obesumbacterium proteus]MCE9930069.1 lysozyme [Obesumbacterium proteus]
MTNNPTVTGEAGLRLIKEFEGLRLAKYLDAVGKWTIGYGHLILPNENYDQPISLDVANALLRADLKRTEEGVRNSVTVTINQNQFDALVSFAFNLGVGNLKSSTLLRLLNEGNIFAAADQFLRWNKAGGRELPGLTRRRRAERDLFIYML